MLDSYEFCLLKKREEWKSNMKRNCEHKGIVRLAARIMSVGLCILDDR